MSGRMSLLPAYAETTDDGRIRCTVCGNEAPDVASLEHDCIYSNDLVADGGTEPSSGGIEQSTLDGRTRERPTCQPPHHPEQTCENHVDRVITVYYGGPAMTEIDWWVCEEHADEVRETGEVREDREYSESKDGYGVIAR